MTAAATITVGLLPSESYAICTNCGPPQPVAATSADNAFSSQSAMFDLGSRFLRTIEDHSTSYAGYTLPNPQGGGAGSDAPRYRSWVESYGLWSTTGPQGGFVGDDRRSLGGVAGLGANVVPGGWVGLSVDQSHTIIDAPAASQNATLALTQVGVNGSYEFGAWTISGAGIHGDGSVGTVRNTSTGSAGTSFGADLWGAVTELSYYWGLGSARIVPKVGADWLRTHTVAYTETGPSIELASIPDVVRTRTRTFAGAEIGNTWLVDKMLVDLSGYGRFVDIVSQTSPTLLVTSPTGASPLLIQGPLDGQYGADAGATLSLRLTQLSRVYLGFESHFRQGYQAYGGTVGGEIKW